MAKPQCVPMATLARDKFKVSGSEMLLWKNTRCDRQDFDPGKSLLFTDPGPTHAVANAKCL